MSIGSTGQENVSKKDDFFDTFFSVGSEMPRRRLFWVYVQGVVVYAQLFWFTRSCCGLRAGKMLKRSYCPLSAVVFYCWRFAAPCF